MKPAPEYYNIPIKLIEMGDRIRTHMGDLEGLADSIKKYGLLHPIVVTPQGKKFLLVAGGRRLGAAIILGAVDIAAHYLSDLSPEEVRAIELEENLKRQDLEWEEECIAVRALHQLKTDADEGWTMEQTAELIGIELNWLSRRLSVAEALEAGDATIKSSVGANAAYNILARKGKRALDDAVGNMLAVEEGEEPVKKGSLHTIFADSFLNPDWTKRVEGEQKFNLIHCDFPYGISHNKSGQGKAASWDNAYSDSTDIYFELLDSFCKADFIADSAHLMFWFSMNFYGETVYALTEAGWKVDPFPLMWHKSDNHGILPDPSRGPRRVYETALLASRGDRRIIRPVSNVVAHPVGTKQHLSEKPCEVVSHFFRMLCDDSSRVLDPTCGSGTALAAAKSLGAKYVIGLDIDPDSVSLATRNLRSATADSSAEPDPSPGDVPAQP